MDLLFGTKIYNTKINEIGLLIKTYPNQFADGIVMYGLYVDEKGKRKYENLDNLTIIDEENNE